MPATFTPPALDTEEAFTPPSIDSEESFTPPPLSAMESTTEDARLPGLRARQEDARVESERQLKRAGRMELGEHIAANLNPLISLPNIGIKVANAFRREDNQVEPVMPDRVNEPLIHIDRTDYMPESKLGKLAMGARASVLNFVEGMSSPGMAPGLLVGGAGGAVGRKVLGGIVGTSMVPHIKPSFEAAGEVTAIVEEDLRNGREPNWAQLSETYGDAALTSAFAAGGALRKTLGKHAPSLSKVLPKAVMEELVKERSLRPEMGRAEPPPVSGKFKVQSSKFKVENEPVNQSISVGEIPSEQAPPRNPREQSRVEFEERREQSRVEFEERRGKPVPQPPTAPIDPIEPKPLLVAPPAHAGNKPPQEDVPVKPSIAVGEAPKFGQYRIVEEDLAKGGLALDAEVQRVQREINEAWPNLTPAEKDAARRGKGFPERFNQPKLPPLQPAAVGMETIIGTVPNGASARGRYAVVEAETLAPFVSMDVNASQTRQRAGNISSEEQITQIASNMDYIQVGPSPTAGVGTPVLDPRGLSAGNGRAQGIIRGYNSRSPSVVEGYRNGVLADAQRLGMGDVSHLREPVLVRIVDEYKGGDRAAFVRDSNQSGMVKETVVEQGLNDAQALGDLQGLEFQDNGNLTANSVRQVGALFEQRRRGFGLTRTTEGEFDPVEATKRVQMAALARLAEGGGIKAGDLTSLVESDYGRLAAGEITRLAPRLARLEPDLALGGQFLDALRELQSGNSAVKSGAMATMEEWHANRGQELLGATTGPEAEIILKVFVQNQKKPGLLRKFLEDYATLATTEQQQRKASAEGGDIFGGVRQNVSGRTILERQDPKPPPRTAAGSGETGGAEASPGIVEGGGEAGILSALSLNRDIYPQGGQAYNAAVIAGKPTKASQPSLAALTGGKSLWHETSLENAYGVYQGLRRPFKQSWTQFFGSDNPDLALGQSGKGVLFELDPARVNGWRHEKPGTTERTGFEYWIDRSILRSVKSITFANRRQLNAFAKRFPNSIDYQNVESVERGLRVAPKMAGEQASPEFAFEQPESVAEQKARMAREAAGQQTQSDRERLLNRASQRLTGTTGDLGQKDMFGKEDLFGSPGMGEGAEGGQVGKWVSGKERVPPVDDPQHSVMDAVPMEMPEAVQMVKAFTGIYPKIREKLRALGGQAAGVFRHTDGPTGKGVVELRADLFDLLTPAEKARLKAEAVAYAEAAKEAGDTARDIGGIAEERYQYLLKQAYEEVKTRNPVHALKVMWHEIGHVVDWYAHGNFAGWPEHKMVSGRGNLLGRIANLKEYFKQTLPFDPMKPAGEALTPGDRAKLAAKALAEMQKEVGPMREIIRTITVEEPQWKITGISVEDVKNILRESAGKDTPELTRWFAEQDSAVKRDILRKAMRGLLDERLEAMGKKEQVGTRTTTKTVRESVGREPTAAEVKQRLGELLVQEMRARNLADLATIKAELKPAIAWWRGTAEMPEYFKTSREMYAEAFSIFANNPAALAKRAPVYSRMLWNYLDRKPEVKALYDKIQSDIKSGNLMPQRVRNLHSMWERDDVASLKNAAEGRAIKGKDFLDNVQYHFDRRFGPVYRAAKGDGRVGELKEAIGSYLYRATEHERYLAEQNNQVGRLLVDSNLDWSHDLGEYLFHKRVTQERFNLANPLGWTPKNSLERLTEIQNTLGPSRWASLEEAGRRFHELHQKFVVSPVVEAEMFTPELADILGKRADYATFSAIKNVADEGIQRIIDTRYGASVTPHIYRQVGNLGEIKNPATATVLKGLSLISSAYRNTMKREVVAMLERQQSFPGEVITPAKERWTGRRMEPVLVDSPGVGTILYLEQGKVKAFYTRKVLADAVNFGSATENLLQNAFVRASGWQKGLFTQLNYAFWPVNFVRDTAGFAMQMPGTLACAYWIKNLPTALRAARDSVTHKRANPHADAALRRKLVISQGDPRGVWAAADNEFELKLASFGVDPAQWSKQADKVHGIVKAWNYYREIGQTVERVNKMQGMLYLDQKFPTMPEWKKREIIRERAGSPNFLERGASNPQADLVFLFYNPWKEGVRSLVKSARENPYSFTAKGLVGIALPSILQAAAVNGWLGDDRAAQYRSIPDFDLGNYLCIPLGWVDEKQKRVAYLRLPLWEPARIAHGMTFNTLTERGSGIINHAGGQLPGLNPIWKVGIEWAEFVQGKNPVDVSRSVNVLTDAQQDARGWPATSQMLKQTWNDLGGSIITRFKNLNLEAAPQTDGEKLLAMPGISNALGRWIKTSDRGQFDADRAKTQPLEQKRAQLRLAAQGIAEKLLNKEALTDSEKILYGEREVQLYLGRNMPKLQREREDFNARRLKGQSPEGKRAIMGGP